MGKTHLALELANPKSNYVRVTGQDYEFLKALLYSEDAGKTLATGADVAVHDRSFDIQVKLPSGPKSIPLQWLDTPGEVWRNSWQKDKSGEWQRFLDEIRQSQGILLIIPPYRELIRSEANPQEFMTKQQWLNRFDQWVEFFSTDCRKVRHLLLCLNKADLFCNAEKEGRQLRYEPRGAVMNWQQRDNYVRQRFFHSAEKQIQQISNSLSEGSVRCFLTTIHNRSLLELPWIYLGTFLASN
ncbi:hypothetical protein [Synechocystis sp. PCC 7339]|uniref:hypothetical protein n=1 Tax=Synechocystis sp. PCC 7339 TaxID=2782213 RepID=UPI001CBBA8E0|nr:hypothetical protein [Synechocystis sp. PCC 7339]